MLQATRKFTGHTDVVEDVAWHRHHRDIFASCGDDRLIALWDVREGHSGQPTLRIAPTAPGAHKEDVMSLSFNPYQEFLLLSGSVDKTVKLWDTRNTAKALHTFVAHSDEVLNGACGRGWAHAWRRRRRRRWRRRRQWRWRRPWRWRWRWAT